MSRKCIPVVVITAILTTGAQASQLSNVQGEVYLNHGSGFQPAGASAEVLPGDRVRVDSGSAEIVYDNGAIVTVGPGQTVVVLTNPPAISPAASSGLGGIPTYAYIAGGLAIAGGAGLAIALSNSNSHPASP